MVLAAVCAATILVNQSSEPWNDKDKQAQARATKVCKERYGPQSPCLKKFTKREPQVYWAICGAKNENIYLKKR